MAYYYLVASLPVLVPGKGAEDTGRQFFENTAFLLQEDHAEALRAIVEGRPGEHPHPFNQAWFNRDTQLRNALARQRANVLKRDARPFLKDHGDFDSRLDGWAQEALSMRDPLEREKFLDEKRWILVEELAQPSPFGIEAVLAHGVKLVLAERWTQRDKETGKKNAESLVAAAAEPYVGLPEDEEAEVPSETQSA